ncbi:UbiX family flavin prenyltransferase [Thiorhodococcus mannitoliphagus]|uniref:Flavin prenyltransferase UbiX n=1 Tax=Thiorhodococcus mannitoliphagus TaxID=329406 RepID=A0A6P1DRP8_9GAMM|nr:flavin prenyltransferase UbiX [Thiorhodococcus mannitoliphagus]NEX19843.1 UbiX family flavin prenyltransferase [Thiorhodococcus mannitoliphagus]
MSADQGAWTKTVTVAITGASGSAYGLRLVECLIASGVRVYLLVSQAAQVVLRMEAGIEVPAQPTEAERFFLARFGAAQDQLRVFGRQQWMAPVASGSNPADAMVICPCTTGTVGRIAAGLSSTLIERAADVALKERRPLILVVRETPFSTIHLENMLRLAHSGAVIMPASPGFYGNPATLSDIIDFMVARVLDHLGVQHGLMDRWGDG